MSGTITDINMAIEEEYSKEKSNSPALTEATSYTSSPEPSPEDEAKSVLNSSIRRKLFKDEDPPKDTIDSPAATSTSLVVRDGTLTPRSSENGIADTTSITSSETTAIPSWNLSMKDASEKNVEVPLENFILSQPIPLMTPPPTYPVSQTRPILSSPSSFGSDESHPRLLEDESIANIRNNQTKSDSKETVANETEKVEKTKLVMEDPPEEPSSCNAALGLAEMVMAFGQSARQRYQGTEQTDKAEENSTNKPTKSDASIGLRPPILTSRRISESSSQSGKSQSSALRSTDKERESNAKRDAYTISKLQQAIDAQKQLNSLKEVEIMDKQAELQVLTKQIRVLQKEKDDYLERETEHRETINILKRELDKMTLLTSAPSDELDHLQLETETSNNQAEIFRNEAQLAESRAKEQQTRIEELEKSLKAKESENFDLQTKIDWLNDRNKDKTINVEQEKTEELTKPEQLAVRDLSANEEIENRIQEIMKRLEAVEIEKNEIESDLERKSGEDSEKTNTTLAQNDSEHDGVKINVSQDPDEIEATTVKRKANTVETIKIMDSGVQSTWCCEWSLTPGE